MIKVITLNLRFTADRWQERFPMIVDLLHAEQPDFVGLQEVALKIQQAHLILGALNYLNPQNPYKLRVADDTFQPAILANAILSRYPIIKHERLCLPETFRIAQRIVVHIHEKVLNIANTHLHHKPYDNESIRLPQMKAVVDWLNRQVCDSVILMGDFNARPDSETIDYAQKSFQSAHRTIHGCEPDKTFPTPLIDKDFKPRTIDYIFYSVDTLKVTHAKLVGNQPHPDDTTLYPSDHFGVCAEFDI
jgi:endonuclease/exonuclease/phosphatase family metal-dependent hydrolase